MTGNNKSALCYTDAEDKCFGVAGMAIGMLVFDAEDHLAAISIDRPDMESVEFTPDFLICPSQSASAKAVWNYSVKRFQVTSALMMSNVMCRTYVLRHRDLTQEVYDEMFALLCDEANEACQLERDETGRLIEKNIKYLHRAFSSPEVARVARSLAAELSTAHTILRDRLTDFLSQLS